MCKTTSQTPVTLQQLTSLQHQRTYLMAAGQISTKLIPVFYWNSIWAHSIERIAQEEVKLLLRRPLATIPPPMMTLLTMRMRIVSCRPHQSFQRTFLSAKNRLWLKRFTITSNFRTHVTLIFKSSDMPASLRCTKLTYCLKWSAKRLIRYIASYMSVERRLASIQASIVRRETSSLSHLRNIFKISLRTCGGRWAERFWMEMIILKH